MVGSRSHKGPVAHCFLVVHSSVDHQTLRLHVGSCHCINFGLKGVPISVLQGLSAMEPLRKEGSETPRFIIQEDNPKHHPNTSRVRACSEGA